MATRRNLEDYFARQQIQDHIHELERRHAVEFQSNFDDLCLNIRAVARTTTGDDIRASRPISYISILHVWPPNLVHIVNDVLDDLVEDIERQWRFMCIQFFPETDILDVENLADKFAKGGYHNVLPDMPQLRLLFGSWREMQLSEPHRGKDPSES